MCDLTHRFGHLNIVKELIEQHKVTCDLFDKMEMPEEEGTFAADIAAREGHLPVN